MAVQEHRTDPGLAREFRRLRARPAVLVTALVFAALAGFGGLGVVPALMGFRGDRAGSAGVRAIAAGP